MATGLSLHIGVNICSAAHYAGWEGPLQYCEADANAALAIADSQGFRPTQLLTKKASRGAVMQGIKDAATALEPGDLFLLTYAGHGGQIRDTNFDEADGADETLCLYDGQLLDDELDLLWAEFKPGVRILMLSDSCHSGTVTRAARDENIVAELSADEAMELYGSTTPSFRYMPRNVAMEVYRSNSEFYDGVQRDIPAEKPNVEASVLLISGCQDDQLSGEGWGNGLFTAALNQIWAAGQFQGSYADFHQQILSRMPERQQPALFPTGVENPAFVSQRPFTI